MDAMVKVWVLLAIGMTLHIAPIAMKLDKFGALLCFSSSLFALGGAIVTSKDLIELERLQAKQIVLSRELTDSQLAWEAAQEEQKLQDKYLIVQSEPVQIEQPEQDDPRKKLERSYELTNTLIDQLIDRQKLTKKAEQKLSEGAEKLLEYASKKDWLELRTLAKNWGRNNSFNSKDVESFCRELIQAELAEWDDNGKWRVIPKKT